MNKYQVLDKYTNKSLTDIEILLEVNRDKSAQWTPYDANDLIFYPQEVLEWIDPNYYQINIFEEA